MGRYRFTAWILAAVAAALVYPRIFLQWGPLEVGGMELPAIDLRNKWILLAIVQLVMFAMGVKMRLADFAGVLRTPYPVLIGVSLQFLVMPLVGYGLAKLFAFPPEIAAGVVLIGSCSSGLASNVMCYLAGANLALSITLTAAATIVAPLATPFWMKTLAGEFIEIDPWRMMVQIVQMVLLPIGAAMIHDYLRHATQRARWSLNLIAVAGGVVAAWLSFEAYHAADAHWVMLPDTTRQMLIMLSVTLAVGPAYHFVVQVWPWIDRQIHVLSMFGIVYFTAVTTAAGRESLLTAGLALFAAAVIHNGAGYALGYVLSRATGLPRESAVTVAFEVGMQNGGMASGLAGLMGKLGTVGLAAAVFSPWMNISGSILANQVRRRWNSESNDPSQRLADAQPEIND